MNQNSNIPASNRDVAPSDNRPKDAEKIDHARIETERLRDEYQPLLTTFGRLSSEADAVAEPTSDAEAVAAGGIIKRMRDLRHEAEATRVVEVEPHLRRKNAGDGFFNGIIEALQPADKRTRQSRPGLIDKVQAKIDAYQNKKEAAERARLEEENRKAEAARRAAEEAAAAERRRLEAAERERREAEDRAARARTEETRRQRETEAKDAQVREVAAAAAAKAAEVTVAKATEQSQDARIATLARPAEVVRTRGQTAESGDVLLTKATEKIAQLVDRGALTDEAKLILFEFLTDAEVDKAVRAYANSTGHRGKMAGCLIEIRKKGVTR